MLLIKNGYVKTMAGADIENGAVLIDDNGKILAVGNSFCYRFVQEFYGVAMAGGEEIFMTNLY